MDTTPNCNVAPVFTIPPLIPKETSSMVPKYALPLEAPLVNQMPGPLRPKPYRIMQNISKIATGIHQNAVIDKEQRLWVFGATFMARDPDGTYSNDMPQNVSYTPKMIAEDVLTACASGWHILYVTKGHKLWGWGSNIDYELGLGDQMRRTEPAYIMDKTVCVSGCEGQSFAIREDSSLWGWGDNRCRTLLQPSKKCVRPVHLMNSIRSVHAGSDIVLAIDENQCLWAWGFTGDGLIFSQSPYMICSPVKLMEDVKSVSVSSVYDGYYFVLLNNGDLYSIGNGEPGSMVSYKLRKSLGNLPIKVMENVEEIKAGHEFTLILLKDGRLFSIGRNDLGQCGNGKSTGSIRKPIFLMPHVATMGAGHFHGLGLQDNGDLWIWGGDYGRSR